LQRCLGFLGVNSYRTAAACIVCDGQLLAAAEKEPFRRAEDSLVQRRQAETSHLFENDIGLSATVVCLIGIMAVDNATAVKQ
jgi:predicted NodU family carbamoyl transferase